MVAKGRRGAQQQMSAPFAQESLLLAPPPGLEAVTEAAADLAPPPGLCAASEVKAGKAPVCQVRIRGMPNGLLSDGMLDAIFEEARVRDVVSYSAEHGRPCGQVSVFFSSKVAGEKCVAHFKGCQWHPSGPVKTQLIVLVNEEKSDVGKLTLQAAQLRESCKAMTDALSRNWALAPEKLAGSRSGLPASSFSKLTEEDWLPKPKAKAASKPFGEDPAFITLSPSLASPFSFCSSATPFRPAAKEPKLVQQGSDASTDAGESETEEGDLERSASSQAASPAFVTVA